MTTWIIAASVGVLAYLWGYTRAGYRYGHDPVYFNNSQSLLIAPTLVLPVALTLWWLS